MHPVPWVHDGSWRWVLTDNVIAFFARYVIAKICVLEIVNSSLQRTLRYVRHTWSDHVISASAARVAAAAGYIQRYRRTSVDVDIRFRILINDRIGRSIAVIHYDDIAAN